MAPKSSRRRNLVIPSAIAALFFSLLTVPAAPAPMASDFVQKVPEDATEVLDPEGAACGGAQTMEESTACAALWGCNNYHGTGSGEITVDGFQHDVDSGGTWTDGCGGRKCDDEAQGTYDGGEGWFQVREVKNGDRCFVSCTLDGVTASGTNDSNDWVNPQKADNGRWVTFRCVVGEREFNGVMGP